MSRLILEAYGLFPHEMIGAPDWAYRETFDIDATVTGATVLRRMLLKRGSIQIQPPLLQGLLTDRFALKAHREIRETDAYRLVRLHPSGELGPNLRQVVVDCRPVDALSPCRMGGTGPGQYAMTGIEWPGYVIGLLAQRLGAHVTDETGLSGQFNLVLEWTPDLGQVPAGSLGDRVSLFTAVQEQLGLKIERARGPTEVFVIDHVERPTPN